MKTREGITTGQVSGMTGIPIETIQRYIKTYPECFSDGSRRSARGRRYVDHDIKTLLLIRSLIGKKMSQADIRAEVKDLQDRGVLDLVSPLYNMADMIKFSSQVDKRLKRIDEYFHMLRRSRSLFRDHTKALFDFVKEQNAIISDQSKRIARVELAQGRRMQSSEPPKIESLKTRLFEFLDKPFYEK
jgi:DNA-binding transcriptional MerR regulator